MDAPFPKDMIPCIADFFKRVHPTLKPGQNVYEEVLRSALFFPLQRRAEMWEMFQTMRVRNPTTVMEIGADKGGGLYHFCQGLPTVEKVIGAEIRGTPYRHLFDKNFPDIDFCWVEGSSYDPAAVALVDTFLTGDKIDVLFIDGDKSAFIKDFDAYLPMMNPRGLVFMHDVVDGDMKRDFEAVGKRGYQTRLIHDVSDSLAAAEREAKGVPVDCPYEGWLRYWRGRSCSVGVIYLESKGT